MSKDVRVLVVLADGFEEVEALCPIDMLRRSGAHVTLAALSNKIVVSSHHVTFVADALLDAVKDQEWDAIVLPGGGKGAENLAASEAVLTTVVRLFNEGKLVAAICASPAVVLGGSGILEGRKVTCYPGCDSAAPSISFDHTCRVIRDGNLITSEGAGTALEFAMEIVGYLFGEESRSALEKRVVY